MLDLHSLPLGPKVALVIGFAIGITSFILFLRYPIILILMKFKPEYRESVRKMLKQKKQKTAYKRR